ncbi:uncharacterized protein LOC110985697 [Acanthaster planci]|uniref:Uncharacterized protein LOC110985697 n=1 Tax=Acanthaster planci TaxID=133434 RepID=A0A8B7ZH74_ACAPL|nr:uncharacterized protein LOC110985697 [Acanthaster planci]
MSSLIYLGVLLLLGCSLITTGHARLNPALRGIVQMNQQYKTALESDDKASILAMYVPDVLVLPEGYPGYVGKEKLGNNMNWISYVGTVEYDIKYLDFLNGNNVRVLELKTSTVKDKQGNIMFKGKTLLFWAWNSKTGVWQIMLEMFNSDQKNQ